MFRDYQQVEINNIISRFSNNNVDRLLVQLPTGGGKTHIIAGSIKELLRDKSLRILVLTHKKEILAQIEKLCRESYDLDSFVVNSKIKKIDKLVLNRFNLFIAMERSFVRRRKMIGKFDVVIIDECHLNNFKKHLDYFDNAFVVGFTATPLRVGGGLKEDFDKMDELKDVSALIRDKELAGMKVFVPAEIKTDNLDIEEDAGIDARSVFEAWKRLSEGKKTLIFNIRIKQSIELMKIFRMKGYDCRHLDGYTPRDERDEIIKWFREKKDAILSNVTIAALGFDVKDVDTVIINRRTQSLPLWMQMIGRGSRTADGKESFTVIDMGGNIFRFGPWEKPVNWESHFMEESKKGKKKDRAKNHKNCPNCGMFMSAYKRRCPNCQYQFSITYFDNLKKQAIRNTEIKYGMSIGLLIEANKKRPDNVFHVIGKLIWKQMISRHDVTRRECRKDYFRLAVAWGERTNHTITEEHLRHINNLFYTKN